MINYKISYKLILYIYLTLNRIKYISPKNLFSLLIYLSMMITFNWSLYKICILFLDRTYTKIVICELTLYALHVELHIHSSSLFIDLYRRVFFSFVYIEFTSHGINTAKRTEKYFN